MFTKIVSPRETLKVNTIWTQFHFLLTVILGALKSLGNTGLWPLSFSCHNRTVSLQTVLAGLCYGLISLTQSCLEGLSCSVVLQYWLHGAIKSTQRQPTSSSNPSASGILLYPKTCKFLSHGSFLSCPPSMPPTDQPEAVSTVLAVLFPAPVWMVAHNHL